MQDGEGKVRVDYDKPHPLVRIVHLHPLLCPKGRGESAPVFTQPLYPAHRRAPNIELHNAARTRPTKSCEPSRVSSASSKAVGRRRFDALVSWHPRTRRLNIRNTESHNRCPLLDRNLR